jgi:hypothetical protein
MSGAPGQSSGGCGCWLTVMAFLAIVLAIWKPWYSRADADRMAHLRELAATQGKSIGEFLKENPNFKNHPAYANLPVRYAFLDTVFWYAAIGGVIWLFLLLIGLFMAADKTGYIAPAVQTTGDAPVAGPRSLALVCSYCNGTIVTELTPGQPINCPHCGAALHVPNA